MLRIVALASVLVCGGCAHTTEYVAVPYEPSDAVAAPIPGAESIMVSIQAEDARIAYRDRVASKIKKHDKDAAPIVADNDVIGTIGAAITTELSRRGFAIGPNAIRVDIAVRRFYNVFKLGFLFADAVADFDVDVTVRGADGSVELSKRYFAQGTVANIFLTTASDARKALIIAMSKGVTQIVADPAFIGAIFPVRVPRAPSG
jgi:uncharacterized lipoprotein YajG